PSFVYSTVSFTLSLHDSLPICGGVYAEVHEDPALPRLAAHRHQSERGLVEVEELGLLLHERQVAFEVVAPAVVLAGELAADALRDRKSTRLNSSHEWMSYAVFC